MVHNSLSDPSIRIVNKNGTVSNINTLNPILDMLLLISFEYNSIRLEYLPWAIRTFFQLQFTSIKNKHILLNIIGETYTLTKEKDDINFQYTSSKLLQ